MHKGWSGHFFCAQNEKGSEKMAEITLEFDTIAAISTPPGEGAISIVRLSGDQAVQLADKVYHSGINDYQKYQAIRFIMDISLILRAIS